MIQFCFMLILLAELPVRITAQFRELEPGEIAPLSGSQSAGGDMSRAFDGNLDTQEIIEPGNEPEDDGVWAEFILPELSCVSEIEIILYGSAYYSMGVVEQVVFTCTSIGCVIDICLSLIHI